MYMYFNYKFHKKRYMRVYVEDISLSSHPVKYYSVYILKGEHQLYNVVKQVHESILGVL